MQFNDVPVAMQVDEWNVNKEGGGPFIWLFTVDAFRIDKWRQL